jgi:hypothetical protein
VDLLHPVESGGRVTGQHAAQARREPGAGDDRHPALVRFGIEVEQDGRVGDRVARRHHPHAPTHQLAGEAAVALRRPGEHGRVQGHAGLGR